MSADGRDAGDGRDGDDGPGGVDGDSLLDDGRRTAELSERIAVVVAVVGVAALALDVAAALPTLFALAGGATAVGVRYADVERGGVATGARALGAVGVALVVGCVLVAVGRAGTGGWLSVLAVGVGSWIALAGTVAATADDAARERIRGLAAAAGVAGVTFGGALLLGGAAVLGGSSSTRAVAEGVGIVLGGLVSGGDAGGSLPVLLLLAGLLCGALVLALSVTPRHVLLTPRSEHGVETIESITSRLLKLCLGLVFASMLLVSTGIVPAFDGVAALVLYVLRALVVLGIVLAGLATVVGAVLPRWIRADELSVRGAVLTIAAGVAGAVGLLVVAALLFAGSLATGWAVPPDVDAALRLVPVAGVAAYPLVLVLGATAAAFDARRRLRTVPPAGLVVAAVGAASLGASASVVLAVAAALVLWDALAVRSTLLAEVTAADTTAVEERHLGFATGLVAAGTVAALALYGVTALVGTRIEGQPLIVVVVGAGLLAVVALAVSRSRPA